MTSEKWRIPMRGVPAITRAVNRVLMTTLIVTCICQAVAQSDKSTASLQSSEQQPTGNNPTPKPSPSEPDPLFKGLKYRLIGPFRGGRSLTAVGIPGDPSTYYFGATAGGVWKSVDGANTWTPLFDKEKVSSIGSVAVSNSDPNILYVGTGEALRGNISNGDGVYKSLDDGKTWKNVGLRDSRAIGKVIINPTNPDIVFVAALGHPYGPNTERGIFRTIDGGKTWEKVLYKNENTGAIDVTFDPHNPNVLFASLWEARRMPWALADGGPGSGLYRSIDGGTSWKELQETGLPKKPYGRIGVASAGFDRVYAILEARDGGGLYRSDDGGDNWQLVNSSHKLTQRAWYYMHVIADPQDVNTVYVLNVDVNRSTDGGHTFNNIHAPHGDNHGLWVDPKNPRRLIVANDGGVAVSLDGGKSWTRQDNQPTAQFYHVATDNRTPYYVYGSQQDNSSIAIASRSDQGVINRADWYAPGGGEAGYIAPYLPDPRIVYATDYHAQITRFDQRTGEVKDIAVLPELTDGAGASVLEHRFQWTAPLIASTHDPNILYYGGERVFKTSDGGLHWEAISPDLTRNDKSKQIPSGGSVSVDDAGTEYYDTVFTIAESPLAKGLIWVGTDDGLIQLTRDEGKNWLNVTPKSLPEWSRISLIEASPHDAGTAYVAVDRHQNDELLPFVYKTNDYGKTWTKITSGIPDGTFVRVVREDPAKRGLLYAGTETGVYVSFNDGVTWHSIQSNLPTTPVHDLVVKNNDLVIATHGRSFWILDDISPLRQFTDDIVNRDSYLYKPATVYRLHNGEQTSEPPSFTGQNPPFGAVIYYYLKQPPKLELTIEVSDAAGSVIRKYSSNQTQPLDEPLDPDDKKPEKEIKPEAGLNRFVWDLRYQGTSNIPGYYLFLYKDGARGPLALPGQYQVRLTVDGKTQTASFEVKLDPRLTVALAEVEKQFKLLLDIRDELKAVNDTVNQIQDARDQLSGLRKRLLNSPQQNVLAGADQLNEKMAALQAKLINLKIAANEDTFAYPPRLDAQLAYLALAVGQDTNSAPTEAEYGEFTKLKKQADGLLAQWAELQRTDFAKFQGLPT
jgi:photosystem II stability/assembly factor-like uncharacterized protein